MNTENLKDKTVSELKSELKMLKSSMGIVIGISAVLFVVTLYGLFTKEDKSTDMALMVVAIACSGSIPYQLSSIKKIKKELESRKIEG